MDGRLKMKNSQLSDVDGRLEITTGRYRWHLEIIWHMDNGFGYGYGYRYRWQIRNHSWQLTREAGTAATAW